MTNITFITSNQTKVAHAKYLCKDYDVNILQYKKLFYGVGYHEPRIYDRDELLKESFDDAVKRWEKNVSNYGERLFFIEDTSVRIDALSDDNKEVPGVDIKYWMRENSFESLDRKLRERGNNRKVSVSSHVILFLTDDLRKRLGTQDKYRIFKSTTYGHIVEKEEDFETQILYPWLDNKTFNKWFVPDGFNQPISRLEIKDADKGDFRRGAFLDMLAFLRDNNQINKTSNPSFVPELQFYDIFIVCGQTCSGKSTIGKYLANNFGYYHLEASDFMTLRYLETHGTKSSIDKNVFAEAMLKNNPEFVVQSLLDYIHSHGIYDKFVITGFRTCTEIKGFVRKFPTRNVRIIYLQADFSRRYKRWVSRHRDREQYTIERFSEIDNIQNTIGVANIPQIKGVETFNNNGDLLSDYYKNFHNCFLNDIIEEQNYYDEHKILSSTKKLSLEKSILITLALEYQKNEDAFFTTTEISKLINSTFVHIKKSKDNISRYFNQSYYLYYEIRKENKKNKYRISPIGYSEALNLLKALSLSL